MSIWTSCLITGGQGPQADLVGKLRRRARFPTGEEALHLSFRFFFRFFHQAEMDRGSLAPDRLLIGRRKFHDARQRVERAKMD
jgi:hypothetical protein